MPDELCELRPDSELREIILRHLHRHSESKGVNVRPVDFTPPISLRDIGRVGGQLFDLGFIREFPGRYPDSWWMRISTQGILHAESYL
jgi:hypothetical protein